MPYRYGDKLITLFVAERGGVEGRRYRYATQTFTGDTVDMINNKRSSSSNGNVTRNKSNVHEEQRVMTKELR